jgi:hypothetical protein
MLSTVVTELPDISDSHGAITSLYAGTASAAGGYNGKVSLPPSNTPLACRLLFPVSHHLDPPHASTSEGSQPGHREAVVGLV